MKRLLALTLGLMILGMTAASLSPGGAEEKYPAVVVVITLDEQGKPWRQGLGVVMGKGGLVLTSASLLDHCWGGVIQANGSLFLMKGMLKRDELHDLAWVKVESADWPAPPLAVSRLRVPEKLRVAVRRQKAVTWVETEVEGTLPFSPRLTFFKVADPNLATEAGAPVINRRGDLVGMVHPLPGLNGSKPQHCYLALTPAALQVPKDLEESQPPWPQTSSEAGAAFWAGVRASLDQAWAGAAERFTAALASPGTFPEAFYGRGVARYNQGDTLGAEKDFTAVRGLLPNYALASLWLGKVREKRGNRPAANQAYEEAVLASPELSEASFRLGELAYQDGKLDKSKESFQRAAAGPSQAAKSWWYLGNIARAQQRRQEALGAFEKAIKLDSTFFQAYLESGILLVQDLGRPQEGVAVLREAVRLQPHQPQARYYLALAYLLTWKPAEAWKEYFILRDLSPELAANLQTYLERSQ